MLYWDVLARQQPARGNKGASAEDQRRQAIDELPRAIRAKAETKRRFRRAPDPSRLIKLGRILPFATVQLCVVVRVNEKEDYQ